MEEMLGRAFILVMDSFGVGAAPDAERFGDAGADTLGHIAEECAAGRANRDGLREGPLRLPNLSILGLGLAAQMVTGKIPVGLETEAKSGQWGAASEVSTGKDTPSGHWEMAGVPVRFDWGYFPKEVPAFPKEITDELLDEVLSGGGVRRFDKGGEAFYDQISALHKSVRGSSPDAALYWFVRMIWTHRLHPRTNRRS